MDDQGNGCSQAGMGLLEANMKMEKSGMSSKRSERLIRLLPLTGRRCVHPARACDTSWAVCSTHWSHHLTCLEEITWLRKCQGILISVLFLLHLAGVETGKFHLQFHSPFPMILCMYGQENKAQQISASQQWGNFLANLCSSSGCVLSVLLLLIPHNCCGPVTLLEVFLFKRWTSF